MRGCSRAVPRPLKIVRDGRVPASRELRVSRGLRGPREAEHRNGHALALLQAKVRARLQTISYNSSLFFHITNALVVCVVCGVCGVWCVWCVVCGLWCVCLHNAKGLGTRTYWTLSMVGVLYIYVYIPGKHLNPFTTGNPFWGTKSLGFSIGRGSGALKGLIS